MALFGEKYDDEVRVLSFGDFSTELCGGTHVRRTGDIGLFKIVSEGGIQAGVRRIEAVTGQGALDWVAKSDQVLRELASIVKANRDDVEDKVRQLAERSRKLEKEVAGLKSKLASGQGGGDLASSAVDVAGIKVVAMRVDGADAPALRDAVDQLKSKLRSAAIVLASVQEPDKVVLIAGVTPGSGCQAEGRRPGQRGRPDGRRPRRRAPRYGAGGRQRSDEARRGAGSSRAVGRGEAHRSIDLSRTFQLGVRGANSDAFRGGAAPL